MRRRVRDSERGASLVELALILPVLALVVFGTIDLVRAYRLDIRLENAAREGAAYAQLRPNDVDCPSDAVRGDGNDVIGRVGLEEGNLAAEPGFVIRVYGGSSHPLAALYDSTSPPASPSACESAGGAAPLDSGDRVRVEVGATFDVLTPLVGAIVGETIEMSSAAESEVQPR